MMWIMIVCSLIFLWRLRLKIVIVSGNSMQPTLYSGDVLLTIRAKNIKRYDLIVFKQKNKLYIKRVIALPGENIKINPPYTLINDLPLIENYLKADEQNQFRKKINQQVVSNTYFVMGDNRRSSVDSRVLGVIEKENIIAKVCCRLWNKGGSE